MAMSAEEKRARARARYAARKAEGTLPARKKRTSFGRRKTRAALRMGPFDINVAAARKFAKTAKTKTQAKAMAGKLARLERAAKKIASAAKKAKTTAKSAAKGLPKKRAARGGRRHGAA